MHSLWTVWREEKSLFRSLNQLGIVSMVVILMVTVMVVILMMMYSDDFDGDDPSIKLAFSL